MPKFYVEHVEVRELKIGSIVEASNRDEAFEKARGGEAIHESEITNPECWERKHFSGREVTDQFADEWITKRKELDVEHD
jgi:hypothetical protein